MANLLERLRPAISGSSTILWPGPIPAGMERPSITFHALSAMVCEDAYLAAVAHFRSAEVTVATSDPIFIVRERAETIWRAARDAAGEPLAKDTDSLQEMLTPELREQLWAEWLAVQGQFAVGPHSEAELVDLVEALKKNYPVERLVGWPSSWLLKLLRILVDQSSSSQTTSSSGSSPSGRAPESSTGE